MPLQLERPGGTALSNARENSTGLSITPYFRYFWMPDRMKPAITDSGSVHLCVSDVRCRWTSTAFGSAAETVRPFHASTSCWAAERLPEGSIACEASATLMLRGPLCFLLGGRLTGVVVVGTVAGVVAGGVLAPVVVVLGAGRVLVVGSDGGVLGAFGAVTVVALGSFAAVVSSLRAVAGSFDRLAELHPASTGANAISRSHLRIRGRLPRKRGCERHWWG
jgi:hypothetical protein